ncbi:MAG: hypothetical protein ACO1N3_01805 [Gammaproteobacteria bacterium]
MKDYEQIDLDYDFIKAMILNMVMIANSLVEFLKIIPFTVETLSQSLQVSAYFKVEQTDQTWLEKCDQIIRRLKLQDEPAADQSYGIAND